MNRSGGTSESPAAALEAEVAEARGLVEGAQQALATIQGQLKQRTAEDAGVQDQLARLEPLYTQLKSAVDNAVKEANEREEGAAPQPRGGDRVARSGGKGVRWAENITDVKHLDGSASDDEGHSSDGEGKDKKRGIRFADDTPQRPSSDRASAARFGPPSPHPNALGAPAMASAPEGGFKAGRGSDAPGPPASHGGEGPPAGADATTPPPPPPTQRPIKSVLHKSKTPPRTRPAAGPRAADAHIKSSEAAGVPSGSSNRERERKPADGAHAERKAAQPAKAATPPTTRPPQQRQSGGEHGRDKPSGNPSPPKEARSTNPDSAAFSRAKFGKNASALREPSQAGGLESPGAPDATGRSGQDVASRHSRHRQGVASESPAPATPPPPVSPAPPSTPGRGKTPTLQAAPAGRAHASSRSPSPRKGHRRSRSPERRAGASARPVEATPVVDVEKEVERRVAEVLERAKARSKETRPRHASGSGTNALVPDHTPASEALAAVAQMQKDLDQQAMAVKELTSAIRERRFEDAWKVHQAHLVEGVRDRFGVVLSPGQATREAAAAMARAGLTHDTADIEEALGKAVRRADRGGATSSVGSQSHQGDAGLLTSEPAPDPHVSVGTTRSATLRAHASRVQNAKALEESNRRSTPARKARPADKNPHRNISRKIPKKEDLVFVFPSARDVEEQEEAKARAAVKHVPSAWLASAKSAEKKKRAEEAADAAITEQSKARPSAKALPSPEERVRAKLLKRIDPEKITAAMVQQTMAWVNRDEADDKRSASRTPGRRAAPAADSSRGRSALTPELAAKRKMRKRISVIGPSALPSSPSAFGGRASPFGPKKALAEAQSRTPGRSPRTTKV